jgi:hypothetical protein
VSFRQCLGVGSCLSLEPPYKYVIFEKAWRLSLSKSLGYLIGSTYYLLVMSRMVWIPEKDSVLNSMDWAVSAITPLVREVFLGQMLLNESKLFIS